MTASITLRVDYLIVFFLAFRILDRDHFGQVFYRLENGVFLTSFGGRRLASSRGWLKFQDRLVMTTSITLRRLSLAKCSGIWREFRERTMKFLYDGKCRKPLILQGF